MTKVVGFHGVPAPRRMLAKMLLENVADDDLWGAVLDD